MPELTKQAVREIKTTFSSIRAGVRSLKRNTKVDEGVLKTNMNTFQDFARNLKFMDGRANVTAEEAETFRLLANAANDRRFLKYRLT